MHHGIVGVMQVRVGVPQHCPWDVAFLVACAANVDLDYTDRGVIQPFAEPRRINDRLWVPVIDPCGNLCLRHIALLWVVRYSSACSTSSGRTVVRPEGCRNVGERLSTPWTAYLAGIINDTKRIGESVVGKQADTLRRRQPLSRR